MKLIDIGFSNERIGIQLVVGVLIAAVMSAVLTVLPILAGLKSMVGATSYTQPWQFGYQFVYMIFGVALAEEFFYRGFLFRKLMDVRSSKWFAIIVSSVIFGISHIFNSGNIIQVITTSILGVLFCVCRDKIKDCSTLSLIVAHGINNALITLFVYIL
jgi:membrane protease YdiL (CAAX protease family)